MLSDVIDGDFLELWQYFGIATVRIADEDVIISRTGFLNELGWKFYLRPENNAEKIVNRIWEVSQAYSMMHKERMCVEKILTFQGVQHLGKDSSEIS